LYPTVNVTLYCIRDRYSRPLSSPVCNSCLPVSREFRDHNVLFRHTGVCRWVDDRPDRALERKGKERTKIISLRSLRPVISVAVHQKTGARALMFLRTAPFTRALEHVRRHESCDPSHVLLLLYPAYSWSDTLGFSDTPCASSGEILSRE
jgi:hypothetical protein